MNSDDDIFKRTGISDQNKLGNDWQHIEGKLKCVSVGQGGVWGVNSNDDIYYRTGTFNNQRSEGSGWTNVPGKLKQLSVGVKTVWGVSSDDDIYARTGTSGSSPTGTDWSHKTGKLSFLSVSTFNDDTVWGCNSSCQIFEQTNFGCI